MDGKRTLGGQEQPRGKPGRLGVHLRFLDALGLGPALLPDQGHEGHGAIILLLEAVFASATNAHQRLKAEGPDRDDQPTAHRKLLLQRLGNLRAAGGDNDGLERCLLGQALGAVGDDDLGIGVAQPFQPDAGEFGEFLVALDGEHFVGHAAHHRRGVAGASADLEHLVAGLDLGELEHARDDIGLRDGLPRFDGERRSS